MGLKRIKRQLMIVDAQAIIMYPWGHHAMQAIAWPLGSCSSLIVIVFVHEVGGIDVAEGREDGARDEVACISIDHANVVPLGAGFLAAVAVAWNSECRSQSTAFEAGPVGWRQGTRR